MLDERLYCTITSRNASMIKQGTYSSKCDEGFDFIGPQTHYFIGHRFLECCGEEGWNEVVERSVRRGLAGEGGCGEWRGGARIHVCREARRERHQQMCQIASDQVAFENVMPP